MLDVTRHIERGKEVSGLECFTAQFRLKALRKATQSILDKVACVLTPTAGGLYKIADVLADSITLNSNPAYYTNYMNLFDLTAVQCLPTLRTQAFHLALRWRQNATMIVCCYRSPNACKLFSSAIRQKPASSPHNNKHAIRSTKQSMRCGVRRASGRPTIELAIKGTRRSTTGTHTFSIALSPVRPGWWQNRTTAMMLANEGGGSAVEVEVWSLPMHEFGSFVAAIPPPLAIGKVILADYTLVPGFICEATVCTMPSTSRTSQAGVFICGHS